MLVEGAKHWQAFMMVWTSNDCRLGANHSATHTLAAATSCTTSLLLTFALLSCIIKPFELADVLGVAAACLSGCLSSPRRTSHGPAVPVAVGRLRLRAAVCAV